ncbi:MAG: hypothetical protein K2K85_03875 [Clostridia bacterium]|nr:hypothetical protein [Clostridia bacterium]
MTQTKKKTLTVLGITLILLLVFIISFAGQNAEIASADSTSALNATQDKLGSIMSNGEVHGNISNDGTPIATAEQLRNFLKSGNGKGYLTTDINDFYWDDRRLTNTLASANMTELNGNGHTITLTATKAATSPDLPFSDFGNTSFFADTYAGTWKGTDYIDIHGGLIGFLRQNQTIKNCKFVFSGSIDDTTQTANPGTLGLIVGFSLGDIDNCSLTVNGNVKFFSDTTWTGSVTTYHQETMSKHSFAMGGYVGTLTLNARVSNSKLVLNKDLALQVQGINQNNGIGQSEFRSNYARAWTGGIVGWMANGASVFNIVTEGSGNLDARVVNPQKSQTRSFSGIVAGVSGGDGVEALDSLTGKVTTYGTINGVINKWTGSAKYYTDDTQYSPTGVNENSIPRLVVGLAGMNNNTNSNVQDIYMTQEVYSGTTFSIAFDYSVAKGTNGINKGRYYSTNILMQDVLSQADGSENYTQASDAHAYLAFAGTETSSPLWAVYDIKNDNGILWSKSVANTFTGRTDLEYYYDQATSIEDAKKFDVTHTEIPRGQNQNYLIRYTHGKAVYFTKSYVNAQDQSNPNRVVLSPVRYGAGLTAPSLNLFYDKEHTQRIRTLTEKSYWVSRSSKSNVLVRMSDAIVSPDTYESFLYLESTEGRNYSYIQFVDTTYRYVSYINDDPVFLEYKKTHPDYEPVKNGEKQIDWQQRVIQTVEPKLTSIDWGYASDINKTGDLESDPATGEIISYGKYKTMYDGDPVVFSISIPDGTLINNDTCTANYEYRMLDEYTKEYYKVDSCVNAGTYKVVVTSLSNSNYALAGAGKVEYCIDFEIERRQIGFINKITDELQDDKYYVKVAYQARDIDLANEVEIYPNQSQANASGARLVLYNVLNKDKNIIKFDYIAHGDGELNMRNVGQFEMEMSLLSGINSSNYVLPEVTKFLVEIIPAEATLSTQTSFSYPYGFLVKDRVEPSVTVTGVDGMELTFDGFTYYKEIEDGVYEETPNEPFDAGKYRIKYDFLNSSYTNYNDASITVDVTIRKREVFATYIDGNNQNLVVPYGTSVEEVAVKLDRQIGEGGIIAYEYSSSFATFSFNRLEEVSPGTWRPTDIWVDKAVDAGSYWIKVGVDFRVGTTSTGWQINEHTKDNYTVLYDYYMVTIEKKTVYIDISDYSREYGSALPELIGNANAADKVRAWQYSKDIGDDNYFFPGDNIVILPYLSNTDIFAFAGGVYTVKTDYDKAHMSDIDHLNDPDLDTYNKVDNYDIRVNSEGKYTITPRKVKIKVYLNTNSVVYGDALPGFVSADVVGDKGFFDNDGIQLIELWDGVKEGSPVGNYLVSVRIKEMPNGMHSNYELDIEEAEFEITPKTLTIIDAEVVGDSDFKFDGEIHKPSVIPTFAEEVVGDDKIEFNYNYFEIVDGVMSTEATENPQYVGSYRVFIADASNPNYTVVFGEDYVRGNVVMNITKRDVKIDVLPAYRIYSVTGSLTPIMRGEIHEEPGWHYYSKEEAEAIYGEDFYKPYKYAEDTVDQFVQNEEDLKATMYIDEYYKELGVKNGVVKLRFDGLVKDETCVDADGEWIIGEEEKDGAVILHGYRNYNIIVNFGDLHVLGGDLSDVERYVSLRSYEQVYNGQDRYDDFRVLTSNENIANALKFSIFKYVAISSLSKTEADALASAYGKYTQTEDDGEIAYVRDDEAGTYVRKFFRRVENGDSVSDKIADAGQYFVYIAPADEEAGIFEGVSDTISFTINKAERVVSADDIKVSVNYNQIRLSSSIEGMEVSFNGAGYVNRNTFVDLSANTSYVVKVRFAETANYKQSQEITLNLRTGIDISAIKSTLAKFDKIDFSNIEEFESKVLAFIDSVSQEDMALIDQAKLAKLQASYEQLLRGANNVIAGAQKAGATAVGKSGKTSATAKTVALSMSGASLLMAGLMFFAKKKKDDEKEVAAKKAKRVNVKKASKILVMVVAVVLVCLTVFVGCTPSGDNGEFSKADLYKIASYQSDGQTGNRDLTIEVSSSGIQLYKYANGKETVDDRLDVSNITFGADGIGFEFDDLYFENAQFKVEDGLATFDADIRETLVFLGVNNAVNGKVSVTVNVEKKSLNTIDVSYDVVNAGITYNVSISVKVN